MKKMPGKAFLTASDETKQGDSRRVVKRGSGTSGGLEENKKRGFHIHHGFFSCAILFFFSFNREGKGGGLGTWDWPRAMKNVGLMRS